MTPVLVTLNDLEGHSAVAGLFKCNPSNICAVFYQISTDSALARFLSDSWASGSSRRPAVLNTQHVRWPQGKRECISKTAKRLGKDSVSRLTFIFPERK